MIYTMNIPEVLSNQMYPDLFDKTEFMISTVFEKPIRIFAYDTYQFSDYDKYVVETFDKNKKLKQKETQFPKDLQNAFEAGKSMIESIVS